MAAGYDVSISTDIDRRYQCPICLMIIRDAVQTTCGHRFCDTCLLKACGGRYGFLRCPVDKSMCSASQIFADVATRREILSLFVSCNNAEKGCVWQGELRGLETHQAACEYEVVTCPNACGAKCERLALPQHEAECPTRETECSHCQLRVVYTHLKTHIETSCPKVKVTCSQCQRSDIAREDLDSHIDVNNGDCPMTEICCAFETIGCDYKAPRSKVQEHIDDYQALQKHMRLATRKITDSSIEMADMRTKIDELTRKTEQIQPTLENSQKRLGQISQELRERNVTGRLQWKVKLRGFHRSRNTVYYSPAFYTGCPGYKVQLTLNMEGFREDREWYASIALGLLHGDYDDNLVFPFNATCDVTLLDQTENATQRENWEQTIVVRQVPKSNRAGISTFDNSNKRSISKYMPKRNLIGPTSRYMRNGCLHFEVSVLHSMFPAPDCTCTPATTAMVCCPCFSGTSTHSPSAHLALTPRRNTPRRANHHRLV